MKYKVLITTSGIGQRLGELTKYTNKALVRVGKKPAISYIIESYPKETPFVVTVGYFGNHVREFLSLAHPDRKIEYVEVDNFVGPGSSLGYSMLQAKSKLQCPFILHASDTIVTEKVPTPKENWIGMYKGDDASQYASWKIVGDKKLLFNDKGAIDFDYIHIGLIGVKDYKKYWQNLENLYKQNPNDETLNDCQTIVSMIEKGEPFAQKHFNEWYDTGNTASLHRAREQAKDHFSNLDKMEESIFLFDDFVIKFFHDEKNIRERAERAKLLGKLVPKMEGTTNNFYRYQYTQGKQYSDVAVPSDFSLFLQWAKKNLWKPVHEVSDEDFKAVCRDFYLEKTKKRIQQFLTANNLKDEKHIINGEAVPTLKQMLEQIDFDWLSNTEQYQFHGDFILENILKTKNGYCLVDWRQNFGGLKKAGDFYYDLSKLNHNLTVNHDIIHKNLFTIKQEENGKITCDILRKNNLVECQKTLFDFIQKEGYDEKKVRMLTAIIWLNMAPLHHYPFNIFLYYFGKLHVWRAINEK
jgi:choline kinase